MFVIIGSRRILLFETIITPCNVFYHCFFSASLPFRWKGARNCETGEQGNQGSLARGDDMTKSPEICIFLAEVNYFRPPGKGGSGETAGFH